MRVAVVRVRLESGNNVENQGSPGYIEKVQRIDESRRPRALG